MYFYRHGDGYPSVAGARLWHTFTAMFARSEDGFPWIGDIAARLLNAHSEDGSPLYRLTSGPHSDIEYFYAVEFPGFRAEGGRERDKGDPTAYSRNQDLVKFRFAGGLGRDLEAAALASAPLTHREFGVAIFKHEDGDDTPPSGGDDAKDV
ncbi:MAG: hypothetical protein EBR82_47060 [Caulobacteraceae bacterium]|nr:hypothetical protein [Caulobacteraceae bacterium]